MSMAAIAFCSYELLLLTFRARTRVLTLMAMPADRARPLAPSTGEKTRIYSSLPHITRGNADISCYPPPLCVSDGKRGPPGAHYRSCQMIGAEWRSRGTLSTWSRLPQDVSGRWHGYPLLAWVSFLKERGRGAGESVGGKRRGGQRGAVRGGGGGGESVKLRAVFLPPPFSFVVEERGSCAFRAGV